MKPKLTIRGFASFFGTVTSSFLGNQFGSLYYRAMLKFKDKSLKCNKVNLRVKLNLSEDTLYEISWWKNNIFKAFKPFFNILKLASQFTQMLHLKVGVPPWVMCSQVGHGFQMRS